ncbi:MAG: integrase core domain-containing protein [Kiritimatiellales bacterium]
MPTEEERTELLRLGAMLGHDISDVMQVVKPATYRRWLNRKQSRRKPGRPRIAQATVNLILQRAKENLAWGYKHLHGELKKLGIRVGLSTIRVILKREGHHPIPDKGGRSQPSNWKLFLRSHMETLIACDFFTKPVLTWKGRVDAYVLVFIHLGSRRVFMSPATFNPDEKWVLQQARNASMWMQDLGIQATHLIRNRDTKFSSRFNQFWKDSGTKINRTPVRTPQANGYVESCIGVSKKQCLNHFICLSLDHLNYINREWLMYYNNHRPHQGKEIGNKVFVWTSSRQTKARPSGNNGSAVSFRGTTAKLLKPVSASTIRASSPVCERKIHRVSTTQIRLFSFHSPLCFTFKIAYCAGKNAPNRSSPATL